MKFSKSKNKVLIIGGSGFLGSNVADLLFKNKYHIIIYDKQNPDKSINFHNFIKGEISEIKKIEKQIKICKYVINFAAISDLEESSNKPIETAQTNIIDVISLLDLCKKYKIKKFIQASSVYAVSNIGSFYSISKKASEEYIKEYNFKYKLPYTILRFGSLYGPRSNLNNGLYKMIYQILHNKKIIYNGDSNTIREYIHVADASSAVLKALENKFNNETITVTGNYRIKINDLVALLKEILNKKIQIKYLKTTDSVHYSQTPYRFTKEYSKKYIPNLSVNFDEGLLDLTEYIKNNSLEK